MASDNSTGSDIQPLEGIQIRPHSLELGILWEKDHLAILSEESKSPSGVISSEPVVQHEDKDLKLLSQAYKLAKGEEEAWTKLMKDEEEAWTLDQLFNQKIPTGNTILHIAASYGNDRLVDKVIHSHRARDLLAAKNSSHDTPLHLAARAGQFSTLQKLFQRFFDTNLLTAKNKKGNTILHDILINKKEEDIIRLFDKTKIPNSVGKPLSTHVCDAALEVTNQQAKSALYLAVELGHEAFVKWILDNCNKTPKGKSPLLAAFMNPDLEGMLEAIITRKPEWKHLKDEEGRIPLHWAASTGYLHAVCFLLEKCAACSIESDKKGLCALHLASEGGHVEVLEELLSKCPDPKAIVDNNGRNILHIAAARGKFNVVKHILQDPNLQKMINDEDADGNTPLHLATLHSRPKVVYALTRNKSVKLKQTNLRNQTALDINLKQVDEENNPLRQQLVWTALKSAGMERRPIYTPNSEEVDLATSGSEKINQMRKSDNKVKEEESAERKKGPNLEHAKDMVDTLIVVSTLIITAAFAGGFSLPGGTNNGVAVMLNRTMFHFYVYCITISMYGAISVTLILFWARRGDISLLALSIKVAIPLLGIAVVTLSLAFLAGVYLAISPLGWLATSFLVIATVGVAIVAFFYMVFWLPSPSTFIISRYLSYLPFQLMASAAEGADDDANQKGSKH